MKILRNFNFIVRCLVDFLLPATCIVCKIENLSGTVCNNCLDNIQTIHGYRCPRCGRPLRKTHACRSCHHEKHLDYGRAWALYVPPLDTIIHFFKYRRFINLSKPLGLAMANIVRHDLTLKQADLIVPVPLFWWKRLRRGYNQAQVLAAIISQECRIPLGNALVRVKNTRTQTRLAEKKRRRNVQKAFAVRTDAAANKVILLVDDVMTSGATIRECARALKQQGAAKVYSIVAGITPH